MDILCCPECKGELEITVSKQDGDEILKGELFCVSCDIKYSIDDGIPNLLPKEYNYNAK